MEHIVGIAKEILQAPNGIKKVILIVFEVGLTLVPALWAIQQFAPSFSLTACLQIGWQNAGDWIASSLLVLLLLLTSWFIVLKVIEDIPAVLVASINRLTGGFLRKWIIVGIAQSTLGLLRLFNIMKIDKKANKVFPLPNASRFREYIETMEENMTLELEETGIGSTGNRLQGIIFGMFLEYCFFFPAELKRPIIFWGLLVTFCFMVGLSVYSRVYLVEIVRQVKRLKPIGNYFEIKGWVEEQLRKFKMSAEISDDGHEIFQVKEDDRLIQISVNAADTVVRVGEISKAWEESQDRVWKAILFIQALPTVETQEYCSQQDGRLAVIHADSEETVKATFYKYFG